MAVNGNKNQSKYNLTDDLLKTFVVIILGFILWLYPFLFPKTILIIVNDIISPIILKLITIGFVILYYFIIQFKYGKNIVYELAFKIIFFPLYILYKIVEIMFSTFDIINKILNLLQKQLSWVVIVFFVYVEFLLIFHDCNIYLYIVFLVFSLFILVWLFIWLMNWVFKPFKSIAKQIMTMFLKIYNSIVDITLKSSNGEKKLNEVENYIKKLVEFKVKFTRISVERMTAIAFGLFYFLNISLIVILYAMLYLSLNKLSMFFIKDTHSLPIDYVLCSITTLLGNTPYSLELLTGISKTLILTELFVGIMLMIILLAIASLLMKEHSREIHSDLEALMQKKIEELNYKKNNIIKEISTSDAKELNLLEKKEKE
ncbi:MAG: hypothetical protein AB7T10_04675 [bacterium]